MKIAVVGSGIAGLASAYRLAGLGHQVVLYEANGYFGGHTATVDVRLDGLTAPVDTGFLVCNDHTYPNLLALFAELGVELAPSDMSFAVRADADDLEWAGTDLKSLFAQKRNLVRPRYWRFLTDILRFNRETTAMAEASTIPALTLAEYLEQGGYSRELFDWYLWPMVGSIWSAPKGDVRAFELAMLIRFCHNHGLLRIQNRPRWMTVRGGARTYVERILAKLPNKRLADPVQALRRDAQGVTLLSRGGSERVEAVVLACHSDQALAILGNQASREERQHLAAIRYQPNRCLLHTDPALMPKRRAVWSSWNFLQVGRHEDLSRPVALTYWLNRLQPLPFRTPLFETLNPPREPAPGCLLAEFSYAHPLLDAKAVAAQAEISKLQGQRRTWFAGAWLGYGFHEDGLRSALQAVQGIERWAAGERLPLAAE